MHRTFHFNKEVEPPKKGSHEIQHRVRMLRGDVDRMRREAWRHVGNWKRRINRNEHRRRRRVEHKLIQLVLVVELER